MPTGIGTALAIGGIASLAGGVGSYLANKSAGDRAAMLQDQSLQNWIAVNIPDPEQQKVALQKFVQEGTLDPKLENAIKADPSAFQKVVASQTDRAAQNRALSEMQSIGDQGGLRLQDKAALQDALLNTQMKDKANREAINADMARRGLGGSGFDVAAQLQGQQGTSDQLARNSLSVAGSAQDRALQALMSAGNMATQYRTQDVNEQQARAAAADKINMFNTQNMQDVQQRNIAAQNAAMAANLAAKQNISNQNTELANQQQMYNKSLAQQQYENQIKKTAGMTGQYQQQANTALQQGQNLGNAIGNAAGGITNISSVLGGGIPKAPGGSGTPAAAAAGTTTASIPATEDFDTYFGNLKKKSALYGGSDDLYASR